MDKCTKTTTTKRPKKTPKTKQDLVQFAFYSFLRRNSVLSRELATIMPRLPFQCSQINLKCARTTMSTGRIIRRIHHILFLFRQFFQAFSIVDILSRNGSFSIQAYIRTFTAECFLEIRKEKGPSVRVAHVFHLNFDVGMRKQWIRRI